MEAAFPQSGIVRVKDGMVSLNEKLTSKLQDGTAYNANHVGILLSGSRPEGLAMDDNWGYDNTDWDFMKLYGNRLGVNVAGGQQPRGESCLDYHPEGCPAAYTKLQVIDLPGLMEFPYSKDWIEGSVDRSEGHCCLNTHEAIRGMQGGGTIVGPAAQAGARDWVTTLICNWTHPEIQQEFFNRPRQWPSTLLIALLLKLPMLLVLVGHKLSPQFNLQARISWSLLELKLIQELPESVRQGYISCKYVLKRFLKAHRGQNEAGDGRSRVGSYHIKTVFLRYLEKTPPSMITSPFRLFLDLLRELDEFLKVGKLPHYFLAQCNLLETVEEDELYTTRQVIKEILADPLHALLTSPTKPEQIYGEVRPNQLVVAFRGVSSHPTREQKHMDLMELLARVDERRQQKYREQCEYDETIHKASGRVELTGLVDKMKQIKPI